MSVLTVPTKQTPFPYAATGIVAYTGKAEIVFEETGSSITLTSGGTTIADEDAIVHAIAKDAGLPYDSEKVLGPKSSLFSLG